MDNFWASVGTVHFNYRHFFFQVLFAAVAAHIIVLFGEPETFQELWQLGLYQPAFGASWLIAFSLVAMVDRITWLLAQAYPWHRCWWLRLLLQVVFGVILICTLAIAGAWCYFHVNGVHIKTTAYFSLDFLPILLFVLFLNAAYSGYQLLRLLEKYQNKPSSAVEIEYADKRAMVVDMINRVDGISEMANIPAPLDEALLKVLSAEVIAQLCYVFVENRCNWAVLKDGRKLLCPGSMEQIMLALPSATFCQINQSCIIAREIIETADRTSSRRYALSLSPRYTDTNYPHLRTVSQRFASNFRSWWKNDQV